MNNEKNHRNILEVRAYVEVGTQSLDIQLTTDPMSDLENLDLGQIEYMLMKANKLPDNLPITLYSIQFRSSN